MGKKRFILFLPVIEKDREKWMKHPNLHISCMRNKKSATVFHSKYASIMRLTEVAKQFPLIMNDIHSKEFKIKYLKSKYKLRKWENEFLAQNGRPPTKADIKASPASIREYYKLYYILKTKILEAEILGDDKPEEETVHLIRSKSDSVLKEHINTTEYNKRNEGCSTENSTNPLKENMGTSQTFQPESSESGIWGAHLNKTETTSETEKEKCMLFNDTIAGRLFKGSSFKKRNPRKSLSFSKKKSNKSVNSEESKSLDSPEISSIMSPYSDCQNDSVDQSLNGSVFSVENDCSPNIKALITSSASLSPLLNKPEQCTVLEERTKIPLQPVSLIQVVASDPSVLLKPSRSLDAGWVERCTQVSPKEERKSSDSGFESMEFTQVLEESKVDDSSDDDLIAGSDNELDENSRLSCSFVSQKRKFESSPTQSAPAEGKVLTTVVQECKKIKMDNPLEDTKPRYKDSKSKDEIKKAVLEKKMQTGKLNENYVRINLKKKIFVRGKKNFNFARYKKQEWKNKKKNMDNLRKSEDFLGSGQSGYSSQQKVPEDKLLEVDDCEDDDDLPTLEEAKAIAMEKEKEFNLKKRNVLTFEKPQEEEFLLPNVVPLYSLKENGALVETPTEVYEALQRFGHVEFRPGQEETIMRILSGQSTLLTVGTGGGKSLCYQLPAYLYANRSKCITLVVSPLVSLMEDQVSGSSSFFKVGCLHTSQTQKQRENVLQDAKSGKLYALLVSPEAVVSGDFSGGNIFRHLPPVAFACIDEVHCVSQWSHNFRPSYLMISKVLKEKLGITTVLGLTATATLSTINSITKELGISRDQGVIRDIPFPNNLCLSVSRDENKDEALIGLLRSSRFKDAQAILIYCTRRDECERLAVYIRTRLQDPSVQGEKGSRSLSWNAEAYHAGMAAARRKQVQKAFMRGNLRIVVATVAFGMGINKQDIRGVIHYNMPKDFESYVQEVGRAGRDGMLAYCHLFLDFGGRDLNELRRHIYSNSVDRHVLRKLLQRVFTECDCKQKEKSCKGHEVAFDCKGTIQALDIPEENIHTLLCYLELNEKKFIKVLAPVYLNCKIKSYRGMKEIVSAAKKCPPLAYACALKSKKDKSETLEFNVIEIANKLDWDSALVKNQLKNIEWTLTRDGKWKKTGIAVEFFELGFRVCSRGDMTPSELDEALEYLIKRVENQEKRANSQLDVTFSTFYHFAKDNYSQCLESRDESSSRELKHVIQKYFETEELCSEIPLKELKVEIFDENAVAADIRTLICSYRDSPFNGRAVARILHGIQSPNYPASIWYKCKQWRKHIDKDFNKISRLATVEILRLKT